MSPSRIITVVSLAAVSLITMAAPVLASAPAGASSRPVVYSICCGWRAAFAHVKPRNIYLGEGGSPIVTRDRWTHWSQYTANGHGRLILQADPGCAPIATCPTTDRYARMHLHRVRTHDGVPYFSRMRWRSDDHTYYLRFRAGMWHYGYGLRHAT